MTTLLPGLGPRPLTSAQFRSLRDLVWRESWIHLADTKHALLENRLSRRLQTLRTDFDGYLRLLTSPSAPGEIVHLLDAISTNETHFFREDRHFELLENRVLDTWADDASRGDRRRTIRAWSAGCATGEEAYSLAMVLLARFPAGSGWSIEILATDLSSRALAVAREGLYPRARAREIPPRHLSGFMLRGTGAQRDWMKVGPEIRSLVSFQRLNLAQDAYPPGPFDLILCRNVLIYLDWAGKKEVVQRLLGRLAPNGLLFLGHAESLIDARAFECKGVAPAVYRRAAAVPQRRWSLP